MSAVSTLRFSGARVAGAAAARASSMSGRGRGTVLRGAIGLRVYPGLLEHVADAATVVMVTGTNGKTTTNNMTATALAATKRVACNHTGANMAEGIASALLEQPNADVAVLEVDEVYLGRIARQMRPRVLTLLNLSREFTRGVSLGRTIDVWRAFFANVTWPLTVIANADDPLIVWALHDASELVSITWVSGGARWHSDAEVCPLCYSLIEFSDEGAWRCTTCEFACPTATWQLLPTTIDGPTGSAPMALNGPGDWRRSNALFAIATATELGVPFEAAVQSVASVDDVDGRYGRIAFGDHGVRLFMVKNPASWAESLTLAHDDSHLVLAMDQFGIKDTTPIWDLDFESLGLVNVTVTGHRYADLANRLEMAGIEFTVVENTIDAIQSAPPGPVNVIANYSSFIALVKKLTS